MRVFWSLFLVAMLAGCSDAPDGAALDGSPPTGVVEADQPISFAQAVTTIGTGVPTVQCPADAVNSQTLTWTIPDESGGASDVHVTDLVFAVAADLPVNDVDLFITSPNGNTGSATGSTANEEVAMAGSNPVGDYLIEVRGCSGAGEVEVTATGTVRWTEAA